MYDGYIQLWAPTPGPYTCHVNEEVMLSRDLRRILFWIILRNPVLGSSPDCKRVASVNINTNVTRLQSVLETKWGL